MVHVSAVREEHLYVTSYQLGVLGHIKVVEAGFRFPEPELGTFGMEGDSSPKPFTFQGCLQIQTGLDFLRREPH